MGSVAELVKVGLIFSCDAGSVSCLLIDLKNDIAEEKLRIQPGLTVHVIDNAGPQRPAQPRTDCGEFQPLDKSREFLDAFETKFGEAASSGKVYSLMLTLKEAVEQSRYPFAVVVALP